MIRTRQHEGSGFQGDGARIKLPSPGWTQGKPLYQALKLRQSIREVGERVLPLQTLSNLLWAAFGVNRQKGPFGLPGRTAASASNSQEIDLYIALRKGAYRYDPEGHALVLVAPIDLRPLAIGRGQSRSGNRAAARLIYVADTDRLANSKGYQEPGLKDPNVQRSYYYVDTGLIAANVYLFAASTGLAAWFHNCDKDALPARLCLRPSQRVLFAQTVGYPQRGNRRRHRPGNYSPTKGMCE
jgi:SagB-type dehydrogenase family enzyme